LTPRSGLRLALAAFALAAIGGPAVAETFYLSPKGDDGGNGSLSQPWKSWARVQKKEVLAPGNTVVLMDGAYPTATAGSLAIHCGGNAQNGSAAQPVTIRAENERQAFVAGDGSARPIEIRNCSYYKLIGLHVESSDNRAFDTSSGNIDVDRSDHVTLQRNIVARNNRYGNTHLIQIANSTNVLIEENELYYFHRHAVLLYHLRSNTVRRNYANSRGYHDIPGGRKSGGPGGDESFSCYPCSDSVFENDISEGSLDGYTVNASGESVNDKYFGDISLNDEEGWRIDARGSTLETMPRGTELHDVVVVGSTRFGMWISSSKNTVIDHASIFPSKGPGIKQDTQTSVGDGALSLAVTNSFIKGTGSHGLAIEDPPGHGTTLSWTADRVWSSGMRTPFAPSAGAGSGTLSRAATTDPGVGACRLWIPAGAPAKGAGAQGTDLGATILYRYENGKLTDVPLWDPSTGAFLGRGATVAGLNDVAGSSLFDVHVRLNVGRNGCPFPDGYPRTARSTARFEAAPVGGVRKGR
jgi:hypothetical protein